MAIAKKPNSHRLNIAVDQAAQDFITRAERSPSKRARKIPILIRFDPQILARIDQAAKRTGISRSAWIQFMVSRALDREEA